MASFYRNWFAEICMQRMYSFIPNGTTMNLDHYYNLQTYPHREGTVFSFDVLLRLVLPAEIKVNY